MKLDGPRITPSQQSVLRPKGVRPDIGRAPVFRNVVCVQGNIPLEDIGSLYTCNSKIMKRNSPMF